MNVSTARKAVRASFAEGDERKLPKAERKVLNPALFALGLPTLRAAGDLRAYVEVGLTNDERDVLIAVLDVPAKAARKPKARTCACPTLKAHLSTKTPCVPLPRRQARQGEVFFVVG